jgi:hypothetical protein
VQDAVEVADRGIQLRLPVVRFDLSGQRIPLEAEGGHELARDRRPVGVGVGCEVGGEGAGGAAELAERPHRLDPRQHPLGARDEHRELFADRRGRRGLAVGAGQHRDVASIERSLAQRREHHPQPRHPDLTHRGTDGEGVREVADVLARAREMRELGQRREPEGGQLGPHEILDRLHIVAGGRLEGGELVDLGLPEVGDPLAQRARGLGRERLGAEHAALRKGDEPFDLDVGARPIQRRLGQVLAERLDGGTVPPVQRAERLWGQAHETPCLMPGSSWRKSAMLARWMVDSTLSKSAASE